MDTRNMFELLNNPAYDTKFEVKSGVGNPVQPQAAQPAGGQGQGQGGGMGQVSPDLLGLIQLLAQGGSALQGGPQRQSVIGNLGNVAGGFAQNALFNQFLQMLSGGGQGQQAAPFSQPR